VTANMLGRHSDGMSGAVGIHSPFGLL
jgi:hypothetical protein